MKKNDLNISSVLIKFLLIRFSGIFSRKIVFYYIETTSIINEKKFNKNEVLYEFEITNNKILKKFKYVYLLKDETLQCKTKKDKLAYYSPKKIEISSQDLIIDIFMSEEEKNNAQDFRKFLGQIKENVLLRFIKYITVKDTILHVGIEELINILLLLETLEIKMTKNNTLFLKFLFFHSLMNPNFDFKPIEALQENDKYKSIYNASVLEYFYRVFRKFVYISDVHSLFLTLKNEALICEKDSILSYEKYVFRKKNLMKSNIFRISSLEISKLEKILNMTWYMKSCIFFVKYLKIDIFLCHINQKCPSECILNFINLVKPDKLSKLILIDESYTKSIFEAFVNFGYLYSTKFVKIICNLTLIEIRLVLQHCANIKTLHLKGYQGNYDILFELYCYALTNNNIFIKYKPSFFEIQCIKEEKIEKLPPNLAFYVKNLQYENASCESCYLISLGHYRTCTMEYRRNFDIKGYKLGFKRCLNLKNILVFGSPGSGRFGLNKKILKYINKMPKLSSICFKQILFTENELNFLLKSDRIDFLKLDNIEFQNKKFSKYNTCNSSLRGLTISHTTKTFDLDFLYFLSLFRNIVFLKIYIFQVDLNLKTELYKQFPKKIYIKREKHLPELDYLKISTSYDIKVSFPILFALSHVFDLSNLQILILFIYDLDELDIKILSHITNLVDISVYFDKRDIKINLENFNKVIQKNKIYKISMSVYDLCKECINCLIHMKNIKSVYFMFEFITKENLNLLKKFKLVGRDNIKFHCTNDIIWSSEIIGSYKEMGIFLDV
ncbi:hypothetical protein CWI39_0203p0020 [Hamiltosporidium magnivora]|uniref:Uncharacterized protein n=1 Tax=Hamiltosporidium magnivora TaxID=148818 RepID=A0A4Q9LJS3_9MICR|nr:hypothetical protein CWI39_0203p0020 [Hamiltosporidium magnivora]